MSSATRSVAFHFVNVLWGEAFRDLFLNVHLPNTLSAGNLGQFPARASSIYALYTTDEDAKIIQDADVYRRLADQMKVEIVTIDDLLLQHTEGHLALSACHKLSVARARPDDAALIFLTPDMLLSDGSFRRLHDYAVAGARAVMLVGVRTNKETIVDELRKRFYDPQSGTMTLPARALADLAVRHTHGIIRDSFWTARDFTVWPSVMFWPVGQEGFVARCFHLHPMLVRPVNWEKAFKTTIDGDFLHGAVPDRRDFVIVNDSDDVLVCEISPRDRVFPTTGAPAGTLSVAAWSRLSTDAHHRRFAAVSIRVHSGEISPSWEEVEHQSRQIFRRIMWSRPIVPAHRAWRWLTPRVQRFAQRLARLLRRAPAVAWKFVVSGWTTVADAGSRTAHKAGQGLSSVAKAGSRTVTKAGDGLSSVAKAGSRTVAKAGDGLSSVAKAGSRTVAKAGDGLSSVAKAGSRSAAKASDGLSSVAKAGADTVARAGARTAMYKARIGHVIIAVPTNLRQLLHYPGHFVRDFRGIMNTLGWALVLWSDRYSRLFPVPGPVAIVQRQISRLRALALAPVEIQALKGILLAHRTEVADVASRMLVHAQRLQALTLTDGAAPGGIRGGDGKDLDADADRDADADAAARSRDPRIDQLLSEASADLQRTAAVAVRILRESYRTLTPAQQARIRQYLGEMQDGIHSALRATTDDSQATPEAEPAGEEPREEPAARKSAVAINKAS